MSKRFNGRCPLQCECEKVCEFENHEIDCAYYSSNSRPGCELVDQESLRFSKLPIAENSELQTMIYIPVKNIYPHPDNPRKDLGDLTELANSIKANGIFQNLTVVPWFSSITRAPADDGKMDDCYVAVIGHRRLSAAKKAGVKEVPCIVMNMNPNEQIATMLLENMQRNELTVYEQAQGFQMMINMGDGISELAERTGFSQSTIRRRVKLLELDADKFKHSEGRGATLMDYAELEQIESIEIRNGVLDKIGTDNFKWALQTALRTEKETAIKATVIKQLSQFATQVEDESGYVSVRSYYATLTEDIQRPEDADTVQYYFFITSYGAVRLLTRRTINQENEAELLAKQAKVEEDATRKIQLNEMSRQAYAMRLEFIKHCKVTKKHLKHIVAFTAKDKLFGRWSSFNEDGFVDLLDIEIDEETDELEFEQLTPFLESSSERLLLMIAYAECGDDAGEGYFESWNPRHKENPELDNVYQMLTALGYQMSDDERALQDGTHTLFVE